MQTLRFLQLLCEGHCAFFQDFLREQPTHALQLDLIAKAVKLFVFLVDSPQSAALFSKTEEDLVAQLLEFLTETMLGPCAGNQVQIAHVDVLSAVNDLVSARWRPPKDPTNKFGRSGQISVDGISSPVLQLATGLDPHAKEVFFAAFGRDLRCRACHLLAACLEGRIDQATHLAIAHRIERTGLNRLSSELERDIRAIYARAAAKKRLPINAERAAAEAMESTLSAIETVLGVFAPSTVVDIPLASSQKTSATSVVDPRVQAQDSQSSNLKAPKKMQPLLARVEIAWHGRVEAVMFPLPQEAPYLPHSLVAKSVGSS